MQYKSIFSAIPVAIFSVLLISACESAQNNKVTTIPVSTGTSTTTLSSIPENTKLKPRGVDLGDVFAQAVFVEDYKSWGNFLRLASFNSVGYWESFISSGLLPNLSTLENDYQEHLSNESFVSDSFDDYYCEIEDAIHHTFERSENAFENTITFSLTSVMDKCENNEMVRDGERQQILTYYLDDADFVARVESSLTLFGI